MSSTYYPVEEQGLYVKVDELDLTKIRKEFYPECETNKELLDCLCEDITVKGNGCISPKSTFGGDDGYYYVRTLTECSVEELDPDKEQWVICCLTRYPSLYSNPYMNEEELIDEMKRTYSKYLLDKNFDYKKRLITLSCVCYG